MYFKDLQPTLQNLKNCKITQRDIATALNVGTSAVSLRTKNPNSMLRLDELLVTQTKINKTPVNYIERARDLFELCKNAPEWYLQADYEKKRELLKLMYSNFLYDGEKPHFELNSVFKLMFDLSKNEKIVSKGTKLELFAKKIIQQISNADNILIFERIREFKKAC